MKIEIGLVDTISSNQTRPSMYDPKHAEAIRVSLLGKSNPEDILPTLTVEPVMGSNKYHVIDGHHRLQALRMLNATHANIDVVRHKTEHSKIIQGFNANCSSTPTKSAGMAELKVALTRLHETGTNILDPALQREFADKLLHANTAQVSRVANLICDGERVVPVEIVSQSDIDDRLIDSKDNFTSATVTQSTKVLQGLGGVLSLMTEENKPNGILFVYFKDGIEKERYNYRRILSIIQDHDLSIEVEYLN